ncbi:MAG: AbrB/MazE/SpoVT family DNA-binding domain-containing protein [Nanoarchaeota archaeon]|nr:AbrB/MazE/SpoVT family DNA-binding domain-containing protein [Nanoarchaeota archaeon]
MPIAHITQTGNVSIPKQWRDELGILPNSSVILEREGDRIFIEPLKKKPLKDAFRKIDDEMKRKNINFTKEEAIKNDLYD